jgi:hypothetical protein
VDLIRPNSFYPEGRGNQIDFRVSRRIQLDHVRVEPQFNLYNLTNSNDVLSLTTQFGPIWLRPASIMAGRLFKFSGRWVF